MKYKNFIIKCIGTTCFSGYLTKAPGTIGAIIAAIIYAILLYFNLLNFQLHLVLIILTFFLSWFSGSYNIEVFNNQDDPKELNMDEVSGQLVGLLPITLLLSSSRLVTSPIILYFFIILGFLFFRLFDILKPYPINVIDQKLKGGLGITLDDIFAGVYTFFVVKLIIIIYFLLLV